MSKGPIVLCHFISLSVALISWKWLPQLSPYRLGPSVAGHQDGGERYGWTKTAMCQKQHHYRNLEREITESSKKSWRTNTWNEEIQMEHPWTLWSTLEKLWRNIYPRGPQALLQWPWRQTWVWSWIPHSQRHCECHHGMPTSLQPTHYHSSQGITV